MRIDLHKPNELSQIRHHKIPLKVYHDLFNDISKHKNLVLFNQGILKFSYLRFFSSRIQYYIYHYNMTWYIIMTYHDYHYDIS